MESLDLKNKQIQLTLMLKLQQLQREQLPGKSLPSCNGLI